MTFPSSDNFSWHALEKQSYNLENMPYLQTLLLHLLHGKEKSPVFHQQLWFPCHWGAQSLAVHPARWLITTGLGCRMPFFVTSTCDWHRPTILGTGLMLISHIHKQEYSTHTSLSNLHGSENSCSYPECWFLGLLFFLFFFYFFPHSGSKAMFMSLPWNIKEVFI